MSGKDALSWFSQENTRSRITFTIATLMFAVWTLSACSAKHESSCDELICPSIPPAVLSLDFGGDELPHLTRNPYDIPSETVAKYLLGIDTSNYALTNQAHAELHQPDNIVGEYDKKYLALEREAELRKLGGELQIDLPDLIETKEALNNMKPNRFILNPISGAVTICGTTPDSSYTEIILTDTQFGQYLNAGFLEVTFAGETNETYAGFIKKALTNFVYGKPTDQAHIIPSGALETLTTSDSDLTLFDVQDEVPTVSGINFLSYDGSMTLSFSLPTGTPVTNQTEIILLGDQWYVISQIDYLNPELTRYLNASLPISEFGYREGVDPLRVAVPIENIFEK